MTSVVGVGLDVCPVDRMARAIERHGERFLRRIFLPEEIAYGRARGGRAPESFAARFAAKEAVSKALGAPAGIGWHDVEIVAAVAGRRGPAVRLHGVALRAASSCGVDRVLVSLTHADDVAAAVAVAVAGGAGAPLDDPDPRSTAP
ncbi:MAG: holo-ACP synthase [Deltaproteobacteria bacterium]|nr:MAG: holo-ACP synthase [Deltaproteobacteria bacterium]